MSSGRGTGFAPETPPTPLLKWFVRGVLYTLSGVGATAWAHSLIEPADPHAFPVILYWIGLIWALAGACLMLWAVIAGLLRRAGR